MTKLPSQYENTEQLLKTGVSFSPKKFFYCNADYGLYMIMDELLKKHAITEVCHEGVMQLYTIDREKHTEYVETLYAYFFVYKYSRIKTRGTALYSVIVVCAEIWKVFKRKTMPGPFVMIPNLCVFWCFANAWYSMKWKGELWYIHVNISHH